MTICIRRSGKPSTTPWTFCASLAQRCRRFPSRLWLWLALFSWGLPIPKELEPASRTRLQAAALVPAKVYNRAMKARVLLRQQCLQALHQVDILVSATMPHPPPKHSALTAPFRGAEDVRSRFFFRRAYTGCYALTALPAISIPGGFTSDNLPIGLQLGARPFAEATLLQVAYAYEQATPWHTWRAPGIEG